MNYFSLKEHNTSLKNEILAGISLFMSMAYILKVNPIVLAGAGMNIDGVFVSTIVAAVISTLIAGFYAKLPFALAPGLGINSFFVYYVVEELGFSWQVGMLAIYASGALFILILKLDLHEKIIYAIPDCIKSSIVAGLGVAIFIMGLKYSGLVEASGDTFSISISDPKQVLLFAIGIIVTLYAYSRKIVGAVFYGIIATYLISIILRFIGISSDSYDMQLGLSSFVALPKLSEFFAVFLKFPAPSEVFGTLKDALSFFGLVFILFFTHFFDITGTLYGLSSQLADNGRVLSKAEIKKALYTDAAGSIISATVGTTTVTTYAECSAGIASGAKTGITAIVVAAGFLLSLVFSPLFLSIQGYSIAPVLMIAGVLLFRSIFTVDYKDLTEALPSLIVLISIGLTFQLFYATLIGVTAHLIIKYITGRKKEVNRSSWFILIVALVTGLIYYIR